MPERALSPLFVTEEATDQPRALVDVPSPTVGILTGDANAVSGETVEPSLALTMLVRHGCLVESYGQAGMKGGQHAGDSGRLHLCTWVVRGSVAQGTWTAVHAGAFRHALCCREVHCRLSTEGVGSVVDASGSCEAKTEFLFRAKGLS